jgi:hypothetical protein
VRIWDAVAGTLLNTLQGHTSIVSSVAFSPDGTRIVSGSLDSTVQTWDAISGTLINILRRHMNSVNLVAFSPDGDDIVSCSFDTIIVSETNSGRIINKLNVRRNPVMVKFNEHGTQIYLVNTNFNVFTLEYQALRVFNYEIPVAVPEEGNVDEIPVARLVSDNTIATIEHDDEGFNGVFSDNNPQGAYLRHDRGYVNTNNIYNPDGSRVNGRGGKKNKKTKKYKKNKKTKKYKKNKLKRRSKK